MDGWMDGGGEYPSIHPLIFQFVLWTPFIIGLGKNQKQTGFITIFGFVMLIEVTWFDFAIIFLNAMCIVQQFNSLFFNQQVFVCSH